eukprot:4248119-Prymnesium_polylepis.1
MRRHSVRPRHDALHQLRKRPPRRHAQPPCNPQPRRNPNPVSHPLLVPGYKTHPHAHERAAP